MSTETGYFVRLFLPLQDNLPKIEISSGGAHLFLSSTAPLLLLSKLVMLSLSPPPSGIICSFSSSLPSFLPSLSHELILAVIADQFSSMLAPLRSYTSVSDHAAGLATDGGLHVLCVVDGPSRIVYHRGLHACLLTVLAVIPMLFLFSSNIRLQ